MLACVYDFLPLEVIAFEEKDKEIVTGILVCKNCKHWYPIQNGIPQMLPDTYRTPEDIVFLKTWKDKILLDILENGLPYNIAKEMKTNAI